MPKNTSHTVSYLFWVRLIAHTPIKSLFEVYFPNTNVAVACHPRISFAHNTYSSFYDFTYKFFSWSKYFFYLIFWSNRIREPNVTRTVCFHSFHPQSSTLTSPQIPDSSYHKRYTMQTDSFLQWLTSGYLKYLVSLHISSELVYCSLFKNSYYVWYY